MLPSRKFLPFAAVFLFSFASPQAHADTIDDFSPRRQRRNHHLGSPSLSSRQHEHLPCRTHLLPARLRDRLLSLRSRHHQWCHQPYLSRLPHISLRRRPQHRLDPGRLGGSQAFGPDASNPTFIFGTYTLDAFNPSFPPAEYTLTIAEEDPTPPAAQTPEPGSLALLATGVGLFALAGIRPRATSF